MKNKYLKIILPVLCLFLLTGCTKFLQTEDKKPVENENGLRLVENIICQPTDDATNKIYKENDIDVEKLPTCQNFTPLSNYEGLWTSIFVKPLAWVIIKIGGLLKNYGLSIIVTCLLIRLILYPLTRKTAIQSELIKQAQPELNKIEKKYENKPSAEDQNRKAQEMMLVYQKYKINPLSGCLTAFIQLPLLLAFYEAINRTPAIFEDKFLFFNLGTTPWVGVSNGEYIYILLVVLIFAATFFSFQKTMKDQSSQAVNMKFTIYFMLAIITVSSLRIASAVGIYWIVSNLFTIIQNLLVERKKVK